MSNSKGEVDTAINTAIVTTTDRVLGAVLGF